MYELQAPGLPFEPGKYSGFRDYARQRQMTLGDLLLENRIVFLGSSPETGGNPASPITWPILLSRSCSISSMKTSTRRFIFISTARAAR